MRVHNFLLGFLVLVSAPALCGAAAATARPVTLGDCIQMALERNLDIQIQRYSPLFASNDLRIAYAGHEPTFAMSGVHNFSLRGGGIDEFNRPTPATETDVNSFSTDITGTLPATGMRYNLFGDISESYGQSLSGQFDQTSGAVGVSMTQPLLRGFLIDNIRFNILVAKNRVQFNESLLRNQLITTITAVEVAYYDLIFATESVKVQQKALELAQRLLSENKKRVEVGAMAPLDEKQAESQVAARRADLLNTLSTLSAAQNTLRKLISDNYAAIHDTEFRPSEVLAPMPHSFDLQESWRKGLSQRPDLQQARLNVENDQIDQRFFRNQLLPQLDIVGSYGHGASGAATVEFSQGFDNFRRGNRPFYSYGAQISVPIGNTAARTRYYSSKLSIQQTQLVLRKLEQDIMVQIDDGITRARTNMERIESTRAAREYAEAALDAEQKKLENGKSTSFIVLQLQRDLTTARSEEIRALADYHKSLAQLAQSEGSTLDRRKVDLTVR